MSLTRIFNYAYNSLLNRLCRNVPVYVKKCLPNVQGYLVMVHWRKIVPTILDKILELKNDTTRLVSNYISSPWSSTGNVGWVVYLA